MFRTSNHLFIKSSTINPSKEDVYDIVCDLWHEHHKDGRLAKQASYKLYDEDTKSEKIYRLTRDVEVITINPLNLNKSHQILLSSFLLDGPFKGLVKKNVLYPVPSEAKNTTLFIKFTHKLVYRRCHSLGKYSGDYRYEVVSNDKSLGVGTFGKVKASDGTLYFDDNDIIQCKIKLFGKRRAIKILSAKTEKELNKINREFYMSLLADHLHVKEPYRFDEKAYMAMRRMEGVTLHDVIENDKKTALSFDRRMDLAIAILKTLDSQVHAKKIIHLDIKTNNIMICEINGQFYVNIIDFGISETIDENDDINSIANFPFVAPEARSHLLSINSIKSDIYSAARVISQIFGASSSLSTAMLMAEFENGFCMPNIFNKIVDFSEQEKKRVVNLLKFLGHPNIDKRWSIRKAIFELEDIKAQRHWHETSKTVDLPNCKVI